MNQSTAQAPSQRRHVGGVDEPSSFFDARSQGTSLATRPLMSMRWLPIVAVLMACADTQRDERKESFTKAFDAASAEPDADVADARTVLDAGLVCERPEERLDLDRACASNELPGTLWFCPKAIEAPSASCVIVTTPMTFVGGAVGCAPSMPCWCCP